MAGLYERESGVQQDLIETLDRLMSRNYLTPPRFYLMIPATLERR